MTTTLTPRITPFLWFHDGAEAAMRYYVDLFDNARIIEIARYPTDVDDEHLTGMEGKVITGIFEIGGQRFMCLDGGPHLTMNGAVSFYVDCDDQAEVDRLWAALSHVPEAEQCGWCTDRFGVTWQIVPRILGELLGSPDREKAVRATHAMMAMKKFDIAALQRAFDGA
jgi:predicted 3-demethylubiquinone-9 3-methyltransferase (glyoxalase superfamily)